MTHRLPHPFDDTDHAVLAARGIAPDEAVRQLRLLASPARYATLERPCTVGDGITRLGGDQLPALLARAQQAADDGRISKFVPASGAATRMFRELIAWRARPARDRAALAAALEAGDPDAQVTRTFLDSLGRFAFHDALAEAVAAGGGDLARLAAEGPYDALLDALLGPAGLGYAERPKGLLAFHRSSEGPRTAFEEQLEEAALLTRDRAGVCRAHFTVPAEHRAGFEALLAAAQGRLASRRAARLEVTFSTQSPATDTLALDADGRPFRDAAGALLFRPAGHGALIANLDAWDADLVLIKNIDNVQPDHRRAETVLWSNALAGLALELSGRTHAHLARLEETGDGSACDAAEHFARETLGIAPAPRAHHTGGPRAALHALLDRPLRVCGVVPNTGEPGGGPFWVRDRDGAVRPQIVEAAEVDPGSAAQRAMLRAATHFNPVFLACALRGHMGEKHVLARFVDEEAVIVTHKSAAGRALTALERPGLWNGAMAGWITCFVHVPIEVFTPVKTVLDLLRPEHQPAEAVR